MTIHTIQVDPAGPTEIEAVLPNSPYVVENVSRITNANVFPEWALSNGEAIQDRLDNDTSDGSLLLPLGITEQATALATRNSIGGIIQGYGRGTFANTSLTGSRSVIARTDALANNIPILELNGACKTLRDFALWGDNYETVGDVITPIYGTKPDVGILVPFNSSSGSGKHIFDGILVNNCSTAVQFGESVDDSQCDTCDIRNFYSHECDTIFKFANAQSQGHYFNWIHADFDHLDDGSGRIFDMAEASGKLIANRIFSNRACTVLRLDTVGNATKSFLLSGIYSDLSASTDYRLLHLERNNPARIPLITFNGGLIPNPDYFADGKRLFLLEDCCYVIVRDFVNIQKETIQWDTTGTSLPICIEFQNCIFGSPTNPTEVTTATDILAITSSTGDCRLIVTNCMNHNGAFYTNHNAVVTGSG